MINKGNNTRLFDEKQSVDFYEDRYKDGYMEDWPIEKTKKYLKLLKI